MKNIYLYIFLALTSSCEINWNEEYGGYKMDYGTTFERYLVLDKADTVFITQFGVREGCKILYHDSQGCVDTVCIAKEWSIISSYVDEVKYDDNFILVARKPFELICDCNWDCIIEKYGSKRYGLERPNLCKDALKNCTMYDFWIIVKSTNNIYGSYNKQEYLQKRKELKVPEKLELKRVK